MRGRRACPAGDSPQDAAQGAWSRGAAAPLPGPLSACWGTSLRTPESHAAAVAHTALPPHLPANCLCSELHEKLKGQSLYFSLW